MSWFAWDVPTMVLVTTSIILVVVALSTVAAAARALYLARNELLRLGKKLWEMEPEDYERVGRKIGAAREMVRRF